MIEPEIAFADLDQVMAFAEDMVRAVVNAVLDKHEHDLLFLGRDLAPLQKVSKPFARITYTEAVEQLRSAETRKCLEKDLRLSQDRLMSLKDELAKLEKEPLGRMKLQQRHRHSARTRDLREEIHECERDVSNEPAHIDSAQAFEWGSDLGGSDETILSRQFETPVFVTDYPAAVKAFYMRRHPEDPRLVRNMDLLAPEGYGEIIGGSQREEDPEVLKQAMQTKGLNPQDYTWYTDLRRYGSVPHGGFGLGIERALTWICGLKHVREAIPFARTMARVAP